MDLNFMLKSSLDIDRKKASQLLGLSIRTIDRYVKHGKLSAKVDHGRIWLNKKEISRFANQNPVRKIVVPETRHVTKPSTDFYKELYEETKNALTEYRQKLEQANYRIGQLESQIIRPSIQKPPPMHDMHENDFIKEKEFFILKEALKNERTARIIFSIITYILLAMLPALWYLLR